MEKIEGITEIKTDIDKTICSFKVPADNTEYLEKLAEYAKTNEHLADYEIQ